MATNDLDLTPKLPHNIDAERAVLGAVLLDNSALDIAVKELKPEDFFLDQHRRVFQQMIALRESREPIDLITLADKLQRSCELQGSGGPGYLAQLVDGVPQVINVGFYACIVKRAAVLRRLAHGAQAVMVAALENEADPGEIQARLRHLADWAATATEPRLRAVSAAELLSTDIPPREMVIKPILPVQGLGLLYSKRGVGKTYIGLGIAWAVSSGSRFLRWDAPSARGVLYVDGELPVSVLRERVAAIIAGAEPPPANPAPLRFITPDVQGMSLPDLATREGQSLIEPHLGGIELVILDNLSALCRTGKENEAESWLPVQEWALQLRQRGVGVLFLHHAGKGGAQRGTSRREDLLDTVIALRQPADYSPEQGLRCEVYYEKCRGFLGEDARPFEVALQTDPSGATVWTMCDLKDAIAARAAELFADGRSVREVAEELGISKSRAHRLRQKANVSPGMGATIDGPGVPVSQSSSLGQGDTQLRGGTAGAT